MPCPYRLAVLAHLTERASEIKATRSLIIPSDVAMRDRPLLNLGGFGHRFAHRWTREAVSSFVSPDPDQVAVKFNEHVFRRAAPPCFVLVDVSVVRRDEPGDFLRGGGIREVENPEAGIEPGNGNNRRIRCARRQPALRVVRAESSAGEAKVGIGRIGRRRRPRKEPDDFRISGVLHVENIRGMVNLPAIRFERLMERDDDILKPRMCCVGNEGIARVERDSAEGVEFVLRMTARLGMLDVGQIHDIKPEGPKAAVADGAAVFYTFRYGDGAMISGPGSAISRKNIFLVLFFLSQFLTGDPPSRDFLDVCEIGRASCR